MARHRFRSQPALERSGGPTVPAVAALTFIAVIGVGGGAFVGHLLEHLPGGPAPAHTASLPSVTAAPPPAQAASTVAAPVIASAPPAVVEAAAAPTPSPSLGLQPKAKPPARRLRVAHPPRYPAAPPPTPQERWEQQRVDYELARAAYDANEREQGFRWAQQNNIRIQRYCRAAEQPASFVEGCMNYLRPGRSKAAETPPEPPADRSPTEG